MALVDRLLWVVIFAGLSALLMLPTSANAQLAFAAAALIGIVIANQLGARQCVRQLCVVLCMSLILKYIYWRASSTLPPFESPLDITAALIVLAAELFCVIMLFTSVFVMIDPLPSREAPKLPASLPTVDVFVPSYNEDADIVGYTLAAAKAMDYDPDRLNVWLLDDGATDQKCNSEDPEVAEKALARKATMQKLCDDLGVRYLARERNEMAKAGNLNFGLGHSTAELVVVFDADHAPMRHFLRETVGHFAEDDRLFMVQTPHAFLNPDPVERNLGLNGYAPAEHEMFYGSIQRGLDSWNSSFFCGSAAVLRRSALEEVDGFSGVSITEDCETALELHSRGWSSRYCDKPMIRGLQPETFLSFIGQRSRWCRGMIQIFILRNPWFTPGLTFAQRVCYTSSCMFWFFPLVRWVFLIAPLLYILFDMKIYAASAEEFLVYTVPYLVAAIIMQGFLFGKYRWAWISEVYEYVQAIYLARAVFSVIVNPRRPTFNVTDKGVTLEQAKLSNLALPYYVVFTLLAAAQVYALYRLGTEPASRTLLLVVSGWNLFNLLIAGLALGTVSERRERRGAPRLDAKRVASISFGDEQIRAAVENVSQGGARIRPSRSRTPLPIGSRAELQLRCAADGRPVATDVVIVNRASSGEEPRYGVIFDRADPRRFDVVTELMYAGSAQRSLLPENERKSRNVLVWTAEMLVYSLQQTMRGLLFAMFRNGRRKKPAKAHVGVRRAAT